MRRLSLFVLIFFLMPVCFAAVAQDSTYDMELWLSEDDHPMEQLTAQSKQSFHKMIYATLTLAVIAFFVVVLLKKLLVRPFRGQSDGCFSLAIRERKALSQKTVLYVVEWMGSHFVLVESSLGVEKVAEHRSTLLEEEAKEGSLAPE